MRNIARREDIRDLILDGVDVLLGRYGYKKMTMDDLAQQVGIGKGTIYLHFPSKEEVTLSHIDRIAERVLQQLKRIAQSDSLPDWRLREMLRVRVLYRFDSVRGYSQSLNDLLSSLRKDLLVRRESHFKNEAKVFQEVLMDGREQGFFRFARLKETADAFIWSSNSLLPYSLTAQELGKRYEIEQRVDSIGDLLLNGIVKGKSGSRKRNQKTKMMIS
jgi:AcrR family transcriptional regulator